MTMIHLMTTINDSDNNCLSMIFAEFENAKKIWVSEQTLFLYLVVLTISSVVNLFSLNCCAFIDIK